MSDTKLKYHSEIPTEFVSSWSVYCDKELSVEYNLDESGLLQVYADGSTLFCNIDENYIYIRSNKQFNQTISAGSSNVEITFR